jgi:hypothetical protein
LLSRKREVVHVVVDPGVLLRRYRDEVPEGGTTTVSRLDAEPAPSVVLVVALLAQLFGGETAMAQLGLRVVQLALVVAGAVCADPVRVEAGETGEVLAARATGVHAESPM